jgi:hypothetical protein
MPLIDAYDVRTGKRHAIPDHWFGTSLAANYALTPPAPEPVPELAPAPKPVPARPPRRGRRTPEPDAVEVPGDPIEPPATGDTEPEE